MTPDEFYGPIESALAIFPRLRGHIPPRYPRCVDYREAKAYEVKRNREFPHNIHLWLCLNLFGGRPFHDFRFKLSSQMLHELEAFCIHFDKVNRLPRVLEPLWKGYFDPSDPCFWSVLAHARTALRMVESGRQILAFEEPTGQGGKTADIFAIDPDGKLMVEFEIWNKVPDVRTSTLAAYVQERAERKASQKFASLPPDIRGLVIEVGLRTGNLHRDSAFAPLSTFPLSRTPNCFGQLIIAGSDSATRMTGYRFHFDGDRW